MEALLEAVLEIIGSALEERCLSIDKPVLRTAVYTLGFITIGAAITVFFFAIYCLLHYL